jgi:hypothetical protein
MARRLFPTLAYDALTLEGGLFNAEWLAKVAHLDAPLQKPDDYAIPPGLNLRDEIARAWRMAQAQWLKFLPTLATPGPAASERFVTALLETLGFDALEKRSQVQLHGHWLVLCEGWTLAHWHRFFANGMRALQPSKACAIAVPRPSATFSTQAGTQDCFIAKQCMALRFILEHRPAGSRRRKKPPSPSCHPNVTKTRCNGFLTCDYIRHVPAQNRESTAGALPGRAHPESA